MRVVRARRGVGRIGRCSGAVGGGCGVQRGVVRVRAERREREFALQRRHAVVRERLGRPRHHVLTLPIAAATRCQRVGSVASTSPVAACAAAAALDRRVGAHVPAECIEIVLQIGFDDRQVSRIHREMRRAGQRGFGREHVAHGGNQRGRIVLHVLAHDLLRDVERELRDVGGQIVLDGRHGSRNDAASAASCAACSRASA